MSQSLRVIAMDSASRRLCACIGYAIRQATRKNREDVAQPLWQALYAMSTPESSRRSMSLWSALGFDAEEALTDEKSTELSGVPPTCVDRLDGTSQTEIEIITRQDFEKIMQHTMQKLSVYQEQIATLSVLLDSFDRAGVGEPASGAEATSFSFSPSALCAAESPVSHSANGVDYALDYGLLPRSLNSIERLKAEHRQRRMALKEHRRASRAACGAPTEDGFEIEETSNG